jgi:hypothetical protein
MSPPGTIVSFSSKCRKNVTFVRPNQFQCDVVGKEFGPLHGKTAKSVAYQPQDIQCVRKVALHL